MTSNMPKHGWEHYSATEYYLRIGDVAIWVTQNGKYWKWSYSHDTDPSIHGCSFRKLSLVDAKGEAEDAVRKVYNAAK